MLSNHQITIRETAKEVGILYKPCEIIFTNVLGIKRKSDRFAPRLLNF